VYWSRYSTGTFTQWDGDSYSTSWDSTGWNPSETIYFKVTAVNSADVESDQSASAGATTLSGGGGGGTSVPNVPYGSPVKKAETSNSLTLEWNASLGATTYKLYRSSSLTPTFGIAYSGSSTTYQDTGLISGVTYNYKVTAVNSAGESGFSSVFSYMKQ
jgi:fibronectin type 3 domain-containing protein